MCSIVSQDVFDYLIKHMLDIHEQKMRIASSYSLEYDEYMKMLLTVKGYISRIENFLGSAAVGECPDRIPFVIFGCNICLSAVGAGEDMVCKIVLPTDSKFDNVEDNGVYLIKGGSADAERLLYKTTGEKVKLNCFGDVAYKINSLELNDLIIHM